MAKPYSMDLRERAVATVLKEGCGTNRHPTRPKKRGENPARAEVSGSKSLLHTRSETGLSKTLQR